MTTEFHYTPHPRVAERSKQGPPTIDQAINTLHPQNFVFNRINRALGLGITKSVGTMWCAYLFAILSLVSLPAAIASHSAIIIVAWIAQTFLQLVLLSIIMVGQSVQSAASDARAAKEFEDTETILDRLDVHTAGGIREVLDAIQALEQRVAAASAAGGQVGPAQ